MAEAVAAVIIGGKWVGLGLGDVSPEIRKIKSFMRRMYRSYAGALADTEVYDDQMVSIVYVMQGKLRDSGKLPAEFVNGIIGASTKVAMGYLAATTTDIRPMLFTVCGTGVPWWIGPDADTARAVENQYKWQPVGYPAAMMPMGPSIENGRNELGNQFELHRAQVERNGAALGGYSQGGCVVSETWEQDIKPANGRLHWALPYIRKAVVWGNPDREVGKVWPDFAPGEDVAPPNTGGVTGDRMVDTPDWWRNYAHKLDLYASGWTGNNAASQDKIAIWKIIRSGDLFSGPDSLLHQFLEIAQEPLGGAIGAFTAMYDAARFFGSQTRNHTDYNVGPAIDYLRAA